MILPKDFPKLESPFVREEINGTFICTPRISDDYRWVFEPGQAVAVEKLDGTNTSIIVENGEVKSIHNRLNNIPLFRQGFAHFYEGIQNAIERDYIAIEKLKDGQYFGELCGPKVNGNPLRLDEHVWFQFDFLRERDRFKFWDKYVETLAGKSDEEIFSSVSETFKGLWSLEHRRKGRTEFAEGIVFYNRNGWMCKLRRDMFQFYYENNPNAKRHKEKDI